MLKGTRSNNQPDGENQSGLKLKELFKRSSVADDKIASNIFESIMENWLKNESYNANTFLANMEKNSPKFVKFATNDRARSKLISSIQAFCHTNDPESDTFKKIITRLYKGFIILINVPIIILFYLYTWFPLFSDGVLTKEAIHMWLSEGYFNGDRYFVMLMCDMIVDWLGKCKYDD